MLGSLRVRGVSLLPPKLLAPPSYNVATGQDELLVTRLIYYEIKYTLLIVQVL